MFHFFRVRNLYLFGWNFGRRSGYFRFLGCGVSYLKLHRWEKDYKGRHTYHFKVGQYLFEWLFF